MAQDEVLRYFLRHEEGSLDDISKALGAPKSRLQLSVVRLKRKGILEVVRKPKERVFVYALTEKGKSEACMMGQEETLRFLRTHGPCTVRVIAAGIGVGRRSVWHSVGRLQKEGSIEMVSPASGIRVAPGGRREAVYKAVER